MALDASPTLGATGRVTVLGSRGAPGLKAHEYIKRSLSPRVFLFCFTLFVAFPTWWTRGVANGCKLSGAPRGLFRVVMRGVTD